MCLTNSRFCQTPYYFFITKCDKCYYMVRQFYYKVRYIGSTKYNRTVRITEGKMAENVWRKSTGNRLLFELARGSSYRKSTIHISLLLRWVESYYFIWHSSLPRNKTLELKTFDVQCFYFVWAFCSKRYALDDVLVFSRLDCRCSLWFGLVPI